MRPDLAPRSRVRLGAAIPAAALALLVVAAPAAHAQVVRSEVWVTNGYVDALARAGNTLYLGGSFDAVGPASGSGIPLSATSGDALWPYAQVVGTVNAVAADAAGGWFIGGAFSSVGGQPRGNLAHVAADGSVLPWAPAADSMVTAIVVSGGTVYVAGWFEMLGASNRDKLGALDAATGAVLPFDAQIPVRHQFPPRVYALAASGGTLYVSGNFASIGGQARANLAALDGTTGLATAWAPACNGGVLAMVVDGSQLEVGGGFSSVGGQPRTNLAALDLTTGLATSWNPAFGPTWQNVVALARAGGKLYAGGPFLASGGAPHDYVAAFDVGTGAADAVWDAHANGGVGAIVPLGASVLVAGQFTSIGGQPRRYLAALDTTTGAATAWDPNPANTVSALAASGGAVYVGGAIATLGHQWVKRTNLAALDLTTGAATAWDPASNDRVTSLALDATASTVFAGGYFTSVGGEARAYVAALDPLTGAATAWNAGADNLVNSISVSGGTVYLGGYFNHVGGALRNYAGAVDATSGLATAFDPKPANQLNAIVAAGARVYLLGIFSAVNGTSRGGLAAVDATTGALDPWSATSPVDYYASPFGLALSGNTLFICGRLDSLGGQRRTNLGAVDATTGLATAWDPQPDGPVEALFVDGTTLYVGGGFNHIAGTPRSGLAAFEVGGGALSSWAPAALGTVWALQSSGGTVCVGGAFSGVGTSPQTSVAAISTSTLAVPPPAPGRFLLAAPAPDPARERATLRFTLPLAGLATLAVFDVQGRRVATPLAGAELAAGAHEVTLATAGWRPGLYLVRLAAGARVETRRFVVIR